MATIEYQGHQIPLVSDPDEWTGREIFAIERMVTGGIETAETFGQVAAAVGISIARVVPTFVFPDAILGMKGRDLAPLVRQAMEAVAAEREAQEAREAALAVEGEALSPTSAGSVPVTLPAAPSSPTPGSDGGLPPSSAFTSTPVTLSA